MRETEVVSEHGPYLSFSDSALCTVGVIQQSSTDEQL